MGSVQIDFDLPAQDEPLDDLDKRYLKVGAQDGLRLKLAEQARALTLAEFSLNLEIDRFEALYRTLIAG